MLEAKVVENKQASIEKANEISSKIMNLIAEETKKFDCDDDPAEQIYLACHIAGCFLSKVCLSLEGYAEIYDIKNLDCKSVSEWINVISNETISLNKKELK